MWLMRVEVALQQYGCQYLCSMAQAMPDVREEILQQGGIKPLISAMNSYPQDPSIHRYALSALSPLAYIPENGKQIIDAGGVTAVKNTLQYHSADPQVAISALSMPLGSCRRGCFQCRGSTNWPSTRAARMPW